MNIQVEFKFGSVPMNLDRITCTPLEQIQLIFGVWMCNRNIQVEWSLVSLFDSLMYAS